MPYLADTNILLRWIQLDDPNHPLARSSVRNLLKHGETVSVTPQNFIEFWSVATRPREVNGLRMSPAEAETAVTELEQLFPLLAGHTADLW